MVNWEREEGRSVGGSRRRRRRLQLFIAIVLAGALCGPASAPPEPNEGASRLRSLRVDGSFDPERNFLQATAWLRFDGPAGNRKFWLAEELFLHSVSSGGDDSPALLRNPGLFQVSGAAGNEIELSYSGSLDPRQDPFDVVAPLGTRRVKTTIDECRFLSYARDFYPHPQLDFASAELNMRIPAGWNILGSGSLMSVREDGDGSTYSFVNDQAKGMSLVCGRFQQVERLEGSLPIRLYSWPNFNYRSIYSPDELTAAAGFYASRFGAPPTPELNVLFRRGLSLGGVSYSGLIVLNIDEAWLLRPPGERMLIQARSLLSLGDAHDDLLAHELAHQWWGGIVSWESPADNWITEGLATYSSLIYLRERRGEKAYRAVCDRFRRDLKKYAKRGASSEGAKLKLLNRDPRVYQALVYIKPALMLAGIADAIGEAELCRRLRGILEARRGCNLGTSEFLERLSAGDEGLRGRLDEWLNGTGVPRGF